MSNLKPDVFFDLSNYKHASIFDSQEYVWTALSQISFYLNSLSLGKIEVDIPTGVYLVDSHLISIGKGTVVEPGAYIKGPCIIGENCTIRHGAYVRGHVITGNKCVIGHDSELKNVILLNESHAPHFAYVGDSILGNRVNLGAGTVCANLKLDDQIVTIMQDGKRISTGLRKFGAIIGDDSKLGCNSVTNPGTIIGRGVFCYPCVNMGGIIPSHSRVRNNHNLIITPLGTDHDS